MKKIVIATKNQGKLREMRQAFAHLPVEVVALDAFAEIPEPVEDGATFEENARIKAHAYALATHCACIADDSGLEVAALDGAPGVHSARYANGNFPSAMRRLHEEIGTAKDRSAYFICALVLAWPDGESLAVEGRCEGDIVYPPRGSGGHGYDPIFRPEGSDKTFAEMEDAEKDAISHRARAFARLKAALID